MIWVRGLTGIRLNPEQVLEMLLDQDRSEDAADPERGDRSSPATTLEPSLPPRPETSSNSNGDDSNDSDSNDGDRARWGTRPFDLPASDGRPR